MADDLILPGMSEREIAIRRRVRRLAEFYRHLTVYLIVNAALWALNLILLWRTGSSLRFWSLWAFWPTLWWGVGVLVHGLTVLPFTHFLSQDWEDRKVKALLAKAAQREERQP